MPQLNNIVVNGLWSAALVETPRTAFQSIPGCIIPALNIDGRRIAAYGGVTPRPGAPGSGGQPAFDCSTDVKSDNLSANQLSIPCDCGGEDSCAVFADNNSLTVSAGEDGTTVITGDTTTITDSGNQSELTLQSDSVIITDQTDSSQANLTATELKLDDASDGTSADLQTAQLTLNDPSDGTKAELQTAQLTLDDQSDSTHAELQTAQLSLHYGNDNTDSLLQTDLLRLSNTNGDHSELTIDTLTIKSVNLSSILDDASLVINEDGTGSSILNVNSLDISSQDGTKYTNIELGYILLNSGESHPTIRIKPDDIGADPDNLAYFQEVSICKDGKLSQAWILMSVQPPT